MTARQRQLRAKRTSPRGHSSATQRGILDAERQHRPAVEPRTDCSSHSIPHASANCRGGETVLFTDTVGFISNLPPTCGRLHVTLKSVQLADLLVHVVDGSNDHARNRSRVRECCARLTPTAYPNYWFNKADVPGSRARDLRSCTRQRLGLGRDHENLEA